MGKQLNFWIGMKTVKYIASVQFCEFPILLGTFLQNRAPKHTHSTRR